MEDVNELFKKSFFVIIPYVYTLTEEEINLFGIRMTSVNGNDIKNDYNRPTRVYIPLWRIVQLYSSGCTSIAVTGSSEPEREREIIRIYETLHSILELSAGKRMVSLNIVKLPSVNVEDINLLSDGIYEANKSILVKDALSNPINDLLGAGFIMGAGTPMPVSVNDVVVESRYDRLANSNPLEDMYRQSTQFDLSKIRRTSPLD